MTNLRLKTRFQIKGKEPSTPHQKPKNRPTAERSDLKQRIDDRITMKKQKKSDTITTNQQHNDHQITTKSGKNRIWKSISKPLKKLVK